MIIAIIFSLVLDFRIPIDYFYEDNKKVGIIKPTNREQKRGKKFDRFN